MLNVALVLCFLFKISNDEGIQLTLWCLTFINYWRLSIWKVM